MTPSASKKNIVWIAWERHRRTVEICDALHIKLKILESRQKRYIKHPLFTIATILMIIEQKPDILIIQNPSILLTLLSCLMKKIFKYKLVVDTHNAGLLPENDMVKVATKLNRFIHGLSDITIITNKYLSQYISGNADYFILPDKVPDKTDKYDRTSLAGARNVVCVCTYGDDEPYEEMIEAACGLPKDVVSYFTGNSRKLCKDIKRVSENVVFTDYLTDGDYWSLLKSADLIIDLTTRDHCLVCGAYEATAVGVPLLLSETDALRETFSRGAVFTGNTAAEIKNNVIYALDNIKKLKAEIVEQKHKMNDDWRGMSSQLIETINLL